MSPNAAPPARPAADGRQGDVGRGAVGVGGADGETPSGGRDGAVTAERVRKSRCAPVPSPVSPTLPSVPDTRVLTSQGQTSFWCPGVAEARCPADESPMRGMDGMDGTSNAPRFRGNHGRRTRNRVDLATSRSLQPERRSSPAESTDPAGTDSGDRSETHANGARGRPGPGTGGRRDEPGDRNGRSAGPAAVAPRRADGRGPVGHGLPVLASRPAARRLASRHHRRRSRRFDRQSGRGGPAGPAERHRSGGRYPSRPASWPSISPVGSRAARVATSGHQFAPPATSSSSSRVSHCRKCGQAVRRRVRPMSSASRGPATFSWYSGTRCKIRAFGCVCGP